MFKERQAGKILRINLTHQTFREESLTEELILGYIGGAGLGLKYLFDEVPARTDPLDEKNKLIFAVGPLTGTKTPCASRMAVVAKSPLTGAAGVALTGGHFPAELKFSGYDALIIEGKSSKPVCLWIKNGQVTFRPAEKLWGLRTSDCQRIIKEDLGDQDIRVACIGPAGEHLSCMAAIINERRAAGRKGLGAVMGSKNLKAIAVRGEREVPIADTSAFAQARQRMLKAMKDSPILYSRFSHVGTPMVVEVTSGLGIYPAKNWSETGQWTRIGTLGVDANEAQKKGREFCYECPVGCGQTKLVREGGYAGTLSIPEFETLYSFGGQTGVDKLDSVITADWLCDELGLDTMSTGISIGFAMELYERGILTTDETDGVALNFGNNEAMLDLIPKIAYRQGLGGILADGVRTAARKIGRGSEVYAMHVKGLELPGYDVRGAKGHGLNYATSYTGADHNRGYCFQEIFNIPIPHAVDRFSTEGKGWLTMWNQDMRSGTCDCPTMCAFLLDMAVPEIATQNTADLVSAVTGIVFSPEEVYRVGERVNNLARAFNVREGFTRADDTFPKRLMTEPLKAGASKGHLISSNDLNLMLDEYYTVRGWDLKTGVPTRSKLIALDLEYVANALGLK